MPQLLNLSFGNIWLQSGVVVASIEWPLELLASLGGRRRGIAGLGDLTGPPRRALLCTALKPLGVSATQLAERAYRFALAGIDLVKDDHSLSDQPPAPFRERVQRCQDAVERANRETGGNTLYFPNVTSGVTALLERAAFAHRTGCRGCIVNALPAGLDALRAVAATGLAVMSHPSLAGGVFPAGPRGAPPRALGGPVSRAGGDAV